jgi:hypothetical protein
VARLAVCLARKRKPTAVGYVLRSENPLPENQRGFAVSTYGKVIKRGWDWLGVSPAAPDRVSGIIEVPALAEALTLNKGDFIRDGSRGALYLAYRKAIQEAVSRQLSRWGDVRDSHDEARRRIVRPLERDLEQVLLDLAEEFPLLASLVERRPGGQRRLPIGRDGGGTDAHAFITASITSPTEEQEREPAGGMSPPQEIGEPATTPPAPGGLQPEPPIEETILPGKQGRPRPVRYGLTIRFESNPDDAELGRLVESTVVVNDAHPAYRRAVASRSEGYHIALATAFSLSSLAVQPAHEHAFVTSFLSRWGDALQSGARRRRR